MEHGMHVFVELPHSMMDQIVAVAYIAIIMAVVALGQWIFVTLHVSTGLSGQVNNTAIAIVRDGSVAFSCTDNDSCVWGIWTRLAVVFWIPWAIMVVSVVVLVLGIFSVQRVRHMRRGPRPYDDDGSLAYPLGSFPADEINDALREYTSEDGDGEDNSVGNK